MLKGVKAKVTSAGNGFAINVPSDDAATAAEIKRRAQALVGGAAKP
jgi:flagellin-like hook-associated protein FlgL